MIRVGWMMADASWCSLPFTRSLLSFDPRAPPSHLNAKVHPAKHLHPAVYLCCKVYTRFKVLPAPCRTPCSSASKPQKSTPKVQSAPCGTDPVPASWPRGRSVQKFTKSADSSGKSELFLKAGRPACSIQAFLKSVTKHRRFIVARRNGQPAVSQFRKKSDVCRRLRERQDSQSSRLLEERRRGFGKRRTCNHGWRGHAITSYDISSSANWLWFERNGDLAPFSKNK